MQTQSGLLKVIHPLEKGGQVWRNGYVFVNCRENKGT